MFTRPPWLCLINIWFCLTIIKLHILSFCYFFFLPSPWQTQKLPKVLRTITVSARPTQYGIAMIKSFSKSMHCESKHCCTDYFGKNNHSAVKKIQERSIMSSFQLKFDDQSFVDLHVLASWKPVIVLPVLQMKWNQNKHNLSLRNK